MPGTTERRVDLLPQRGSRRQLTDEQKRRIISDFFQSTYTSHTHPFKITNILRIVYEEISKAASFKYQFFTPDAELFLIDLLRSEIAGAEQYYGREKDPNYFQLRQKEDKRLLEACRTFITRLAPNKEIMSKSLCDWMCYLYLVTINMITYYFTEQAHKVLPYFAMAYLNNLAETIYIMVAPDINIKRLMFCKPAEFMILCLDKKTCLGLEFPKRAEEILRGVEKFDASFYTRLDVIKNKIGARLQTEIFDMSPAFQLSLPRQNQVDDLNMDTTDTSSDSDDADVGPPTIERAENPSNLNLVPNQNGIA